MGDNIKVLAVDDSPANLEIYRELFEEGYSLETASNGQEAILLAEHFQPDVILLDVMMPGMDGMETCRKMRTHCALSGTQIVMVSAKAMPDERAAGLMAGADDYMTKPFDEIELHEVIRRLLNTTTAGRTR